MIHRFIYTVLPLIALVMTFGSCIEDGVSTSPSDQPEFSVDTLRLGTVFTGQGSPTYRFTVYNRHDKIITIESASVRSAGPADYRLNVDGTAGREIRMVDIRPNDSILVFLETTLPDGQLGPRETAYVDFVVNGVTSSLPVSCYPIDVVRMKGRTIETDTVFSADKPFMITDSLIVAPGATLTLSQGTRLLFHDKAFMRVYGRIISLGTPEAPVDMTGDRIGNLASSIPYDIMSGQWQGLWLASGSYGNEMIFTSVRNSVDGLTLEPQAELALASSVVRNAKNYPLRSVNATLTAAGCEIADGGAGALYINGGNVTLDHCTLSNYYLFSAIGGPILHFDNTVEMSLRVSNSIIYGIGSDMTAVDISGSDIRFRRCLLKSEGVDDDNFINCIWNSDPVFAVDRSACIFDYHLLEGSPAVGTAAGDGVRILSPKGEDVTMHIGAYPPIK